MSGKATERDLAAVTRLQADYARYVDDRDGAAFADLYGDTGVLSWGRRELTGRPTLEAFVAQAPRGVHLQGVASVEPGPDDVLGAVAPFVFFNAETGQIVAGRYTDQMVWQEGRLIFARRRIDITATLRAEPPS